MADDDGDMSEHDENDLTNQELLEMWEEGEPVELAQTIFSVEFPWQTDLDTSSTFRGDSTRYYGGGVPAVRPRAYPEDALTRTA